MRHILRAENIEKSFKKKSILRGVSFEVEGGKVVGLLGPNGAGKTTSFNIIVGILRSNKGKVWLDGKEITTMPLYKRARLGISYLPQERSVFRNLTVSENLLAIMEYVEKDEYERKRKVLDLLEDFKISHLAEQKAYTLSGGEARRVEIARALVTNPKFILLDEPFSGIDPLAVIDLQTLISKELKARGIGILVTDHNVRETLTICDMAYILSDGVIQIKGTSEQLISSPIAKQHYLGENFRL